MFDTRALTNWPTPEQKAYVEARRRAGDFGHESGLMVDNPYWTLVSALGKFTWHQMAGFAITNGLRFTRMTSNPDYPGVIFKDVVNSALINHVTAPDGSFDVGRFGGAGGEDHSKTVAFTYAAFRLQNVMPQLVLDNRENSRWRGKLPVRFERDQRLDLGGVFADQWDVYGPEGYGLDVYQIIATDIMETLTRHEYLFDVEVVDKWLFLYSPNSYLNEPRFWAEIDELRTTVVDKLNARRYTDMHVGDEPSTPKQRLERLNHGTKLRRRRQWLTPGRLAAVPLLALFVLPAVAVLVTWAWRTCFG